MGTPWFTSAESFTRHMRKQLHGLSMRQSSRTSSTNIYRPVAAITSVPAGGRMLLGVA